MVSSRKLDGAVRMLVQEKLRCELEFLNGTIGLAEKRKKDERIDRLLADAGQREALRLSESDLFRETVDGVLRPAHGLASLFVITLGDEFQALFEPSGDPLTEIIKIAHELRPFELRFAIGCGDIYTAIDPNAAIGADGPAFHRARRMMEQMKNERGARIRVALGDPELERTLNTVLALCDKLAENWTDAQEQLVSGMLIMSSEGMRITQSAAAQKLGVGQSSVALRLKRAGCAEYSRGIALIRDRLSEYIVRTE